MEVSGQLHDPDALPQGESPWYPLDRRLGGPQSRFGHSCEYKVFRSIHVRFAVDEDALT
jgi:hypothetical protein